MSGQTRETTETVRNKAQEEREAAGEETKSFTDTPQLADGETWENATGHSGTRRAWVVSLAMVASFLIGGVGMTLGPRVLLWIGAGLFVLLAVYSLAAHTWTDYARVEERRELSGRRDEAQAVRTREGAAHGG